MANDLTLTVERDCGQLIWFYFLYQSNGKKNDFQYLLSNCFFFQITIYEAIKNALNVNHSALSIGNYWSVLKWQRKQQFSFVMHAKWLSFLHGTHSAGSNFLLLIHFSPSFTLQCEHNIFFFLFKKKTRVKGMFKNRCSSTMTLDMWHIFHWKKFRTLLNEWWSAIFSTTEGQSCH